jgi:hypothetical protein
MVRDINKIMYIILIIKDNNKAEMGAVKDVMILLAIYLRS